HERACLRIVEVVHTAGPGVGREGTAQVRLGIVAAVVRPRLQVAAADAEVDAREAKGALHPGRVERVADRDLAQLHEARILDAGLVDADERASRHFPVPILTDGHRGAGPGSRHRAVEPTALAECLGITSARRRIVAVDADRPVLRLLGSTRAPQGPLGAVPDLAAMADVQEARDLYLPVAERRTD